MAAFPGPAAVAGAALKWYVESMKTDMDLLAAVKPGFTTISPSRDVVASFDREGRLFSFVEGGLTYRRTLASEVEVRRRDEESRLGGRAPRLRRRLGRAETLAVFARALETAAAVRPLAAGELRRRLEEEILPWTPQALLAEAERFRRVYKPISILPPDQYLSVVLQATEGCTWNRCTFCTFYQDRPFHVKSEDEFQRHVDEVRAFLGRGVLMRKSVFLGDGNALALTQRRLVPLFEITRAAFPEMPIYSFIDVYTGERKTVADWRELAALGLRRVYIGMETGLDELLRLLNKPGSRDELVDFVARLKAAGVLVGLIVMIGVGGLEYREAHAEATLATLETLPLGPGDLVYISPFIEHPASVYAAQRQAMGLTPMSEEDIEEELQRWARRLRAAGLKAARYDIREFLY